MWSRDDPLVLLAKGVGMLTMAELSFGESVWLEFFRSLFTAVLVAGGAALAVWAVQRSAASRRERFAVVTDLLRQTSECAGEMYYATQVYWRQERHPTEWGNADDSNLDTAYLGFGVTGEQIEWELRARYGPASPQQEMWHQVRDLLTIRYFTLKGRNTVGLRRVNARDFENRTHTGLSETELENSALVLKTFRSTMDSLALSLEERTVRL
jgi:hypothetical protein